MILRFAGLAALWLLFAAPAQGAEPVLVDPTRPDTESDLAAFTAKRITFLLVSPERTVAVINGQTVQVGDVFEGAVVERITEEGVLFRLADESVLAPRNGCFRIVEEQGRSTLRHVANCSTGQQSQGRVREIALVRWGGKFFVDVLLDGDKTVRMRVAPEKGRSTLHHKDLYALKNDVDCDSDEKCEPAKIDQTLVNAMSVGNYAIKDVRFHAGKENCIGRDLLNRLGKWRIDAQSGRLFFNDK